MKAIFSVVVGGQDITMNLNPVLQSLRVSDKAGMSSDTASLELDDREGQIVLPRPGALVLISLGWEGRGMGRVFEGTVDEIRASGSRSGRTLSISAKGMDTREKPKEGQRRHFDDTTIGDALSATAERAGLTMSVDAELGKIKRPYIALDDESFVAFGERIAREVGGTFKIVGTRAILAKRNGGSSAGGASLPTVTAAWGRNLRSYDIAPILAVAAGMGVAVLATDPIVSGLHLEGTWSHAVAGVLGISGRNLIVWVSLVSKDPMALWDRIKGVPPKK